MTGSNQDGRTVSPMTAPSMEQQTRLMEQIYSSPAIDVDRLDYIEAHGQSSRCHLFNPCFVSMI